MKVNAAIWPAWLVLLAISGFAIQNVFGARVSVKQRRSLTTNSDLPNPSNQMYMNTRSTSRYQPIEYETSESIRSDSYVSKATFASFFSVKCLIVFCFIFDRTQVTMNRIVSLTW